MSEQAIEQATGMALEVARDHPAVVAQQEMTVTELVATHELIQHAMREVMEEGIHYGRVAGVSKPALYKPGAEVLNVLFRLAPAYKSELIWHDDGHLTVVAKCVLTHVTTGLTIAEGQGLCTTRESKYAWRQASKECPDCGKEALVRSQKNSAYFCIRNNGGCGHRFPFTSDAGKALEQMEVGRAPNPDLPDTYNTVLKMGDKRALVAASLNATGASALFTQDLEDGQPAEREERQAPARAADPQAEFLDGSPRVWSDVFAILTAIDGAHPWGEWFDQAASAIYGKPVEWRELEDLDKDAFRRFTYAVHNAVGFLAAAQTGDFPPPSIDEIAECFAKVLGGEILPGPAATPEESESAEDTPDVEWVGEAPGEPVAAGDDANVGREGGEKT